MDHNWSQSLANTSVESETRYNTSMAEQSTRIAMSGPGYNGKEEEEEEEGDGE